MNPNEASIMWWIMELVFYIVILCLLMTFAYVLLHWVINPFLLKYAAGKKKALLDRHITRVKKILNKPTGSRKYAFIGSSQYEVMMKEEAERMRNQGHVVFLPFFDGDADDSLAIWSTNREIIKAADIVMVFWDQRSIGTIFDLGMTYMAGKPIEIGMLESRTIATTMLDYIREGGEA